MQVLLWKWKCQNCKICLLAEKYGKFEKYESKRSPMPSLRKKLPLFRENHCDGQRKTKLLKFVLSNLFIEYFMQQLLKELGKIFKAFPVLIFFLFSYWDLAHLCFVCCFTFYVVRLIKLFDNIFVGPKTSLNVYPYEYVWQVLGNFAATTPQPFPNFPPKKENTKNYFR